MPWRGSVTLQKPVPHSISSRLEGIKAEKYGPKLIMLVNSFYAYRRRKRTSSSPSGRVPSSLIMFSPEGRTVCVTHQIIDSSQTHGTRPDSKDSTPSAELCVRLLTSKLSNEILYCMVEQLMLQLGMPISSMLGGLFSRGVDSAPHSRERAGNWDVVTSQIFNLECYT